MPPERSLIASGAVAHRERPALSSATRPMAAPSPAILPGGDRATDPKSGTAEFKATAIRIEKLHAPVPAS